MSDVTHTNESCHTYACVLTHVTAHINDSCHSYAVGMSHISTYEQSCHTFEHVDMCEMNASYESWLFHMSDITYQQVDKFMCHISTSWQVHVSHINKLTSPCVTYQQVDKFMCHISTSWQVHVSHINLFTSSCVAWSRFHVSYEWHRISTGWYVSHECFIWVTCWYVSHECFIWVTCWYVSHECFIWVTCVTWMLHMKHSSHT